MSCINLWWCYLSSLSLCTRYTIPTYPRCAFVCDYDTFLLLRGSLLTLSSLTFSWRLCKQGAMSETSFCLYFFLHMGPRIWFVMAIVVEHFWAICPTSFLYTVSYHHHSKFNVFKRDEVVLSSTCYEDLLHLCSSKLLSVVEPTRVKLCCKLI